MRRWDNSPLRQILIHEIAFTNFSFNLFKRVYFLPDVGETRYSAFFYETVNFLTFWLCTGIDDGFVKWIFEINTNEDQIK